MSGTIIPGFLESLMPIHPLMVDRELSLGLNADKIIGPAAENRRKEIEEARLETALRELGFRVGIERRGPKRTRKFILVNGPPRSGKDTAAKIITETFADTIEEKFAQPIRDAIAAVLGMTKEEFDAAYEDLKHQVVLNGHTLRELMIGFSEDYLKKYGGPKVFGELLLQRLERKDFYPYIVVSDSGFKEEGERIIEDAGPENVLLVHVGRPGYDFKGDSRSYIDLSHVGVSPILITNDGSVWEFGTRVINTVKEFLND